MMRIVTKLEFVKERAVMVCAKGGIGRKVGQTRRTSMKIYCD